MDETHERALSFHCDCPLQWRHNERDGVSSHRRIDCLLSCLFRRRSKITSKLRVTGLWKGNSPVTDEFPSQMASDAENVSIWWASRKALCSECNVINYGCMRESTNLPMVDQIAPEHVIEIAPDELLNYCVRRHAIMSSLTNSWRALRTIAFTRNQNKFLLHVFVGARRWASSTVKVMCHLICT